MTTLARASALTLALSALAACGGGGGGGGAANPIPDYIDIDNANFSADSELGGQVLIAGAVAAEIKDVTGTLTHNTRALTNLTVGGVNTLTDTDGDDSGTWTDGTVTFAPDGRQQRSYGFAAFYGLTVEGSPDEGGSVIIGVTIDSADVPRRAGIVTYRGEALVDGSTTSGGSASLGGVGNSTVEVDFAAGNVDLTIDGIGGVPYDAITITGMSFSTERNAFEGGTLAIIDGSENITSTLLGSIDATGAAGNFYGIDANDNPDEVGGVFFGEGDAGEIYGGFIAD